MRRLSSFFVNWLEQLKEEATHYQVHNVYLPRIKASQQVTEHSTTMAKGRATSKYSILDNKLVFISRGSFGGILKNLPHQGTDVGSWVKQAACAPHPRETITIARI